jgi:hypothetical protein
MVKTKNNVDQVTTNTSEETPNLEIESKIDQKNPKSTALQAKAVIILDTTQSPIKAIGNSNPLSVVLAINGTQSVSQVAVGNAGGIGAASIIINAVQHFVKGANTEAARTPIIWKTAMANAAGTTALWTPGAGKRFRLMGFSFAIPSDATSIAGSVVSLLDAAATICYVAAIGATTGAFAGQVIFNANGYPSGAINQVLNINLSAAFTVDSIFMTAWGTEE